ncbi:hypothetical protein DRA43_19455, partial [Micromonospora provocatoris]
MIDIRFGPQVCGELSAAATREWLVTDGRGGYAMGHLAAGGGKLIDIRFGPQVCGELSAAATREWLVT